MYSVQDRGSDPVVLRVGTMALQGEGDPRWVVREREDGRNVNGWHWEDKDVTNWASERLKDLIVPSTCSSMSDTPGVAVASVDSVDGDATLYNRKGLLKVLYDLKISGKWESKHEEEDRRTHGEFKVDLFDEDPEVIVSIDSKSRNDPRYKQAFVRDVVPKIKQKCGIFVKELHKGADEAVDGLILPKSRANEQSSISTTTTVSRTEVNSKPAASSQKKSNSTREITMIEYFTCSAADWLLALTDAPRLSAVTRSAAVSDAREGGKWEVLNGAARGEYVSIDPSSEVVLRWRLSSWGEDSDWGLVRASVHQDDGKTEARIVVTGVPNDKKSETEGFWRIQILQAMRVVMGWGSASKFAYM